MTVTVKTKKNVIERDGGVCQLNLPGCTYDAQTTDHRANRGAGGAPILNHPANLVAACTICNGHKADGEGETLADLERRGLYVRHAATHSRTLDGILDLPYLSRDGVWYAIDSEKKRTAVAPNLEFAHALGVPLYAWQVRVLAAFMRAEARR